MDRRFCYHPVDGAVDVGALNVDGNTPLDMAAVGEYEVIKGKEKVTIKFNSYY